MRIEGKALYADHERQELLANSNNTILSFLLFYVVTIQIHSPVISRTGGAERAENNF